MKSSGAQQRRLDLKFWLAVSIYNEIRVRSRKDWVLVEDALSSEFDDFTFLLFPFYFRIKISCSLLIAPSPPWVRGNSFCCRTLRMCVLLLHDGRLDYFCWREFGHFGRDCYTFATARRTEKPNFWLNFTFGRHHAPAITFASSSNNVKINRLDFYSQNKLLSHLVGWLTIN